MKASEIIGAIDDHRAGRNIKKSELARAAGLRPGNVRKIFSKDNPNVDLVTLYRLMNPLGLRLTCSEALDPSAFVAFLDSLRKERGLSCWKLADLAGTDSSNLKRIFASENPRPRLNLLLDLAEVLDAPMTVVRRQDAPTDSTLLPQQTRPSKSVSPRQAPPPKKQPLTLDQLIAIMTGRDTKPEATFVPESYEHSIALARQASHTEKRTKQKAFEAKRTKWPEHQEWSDTGHVGEDNGRADTGRSNHDPSRAEPVEWDVLLDEPPLDEAAGSKPRWVLTAGGFFVLVLIFTASAVSAVALGNKLREREPPSANKPWHKDMGLLCSVGGALAVIVGARYVKNTTARQALTAAGVGFASGAVVGAIAGRRRRPFQPGTLSLTKVR